MKKRLLIIGVCLSCFVGGCGMLDGDISEEDVNQVVETGKEVSNKAKEVVEDEEVQSAASNLIDAIKNALN